MEAVIITKMSGIEREKRTCKEGEGFVLAIRCKSKSADKRREEKEVIKSVYFLIPFHYFECSLQKQHGTLSLSLSLSLSSLQSKARGKKV
jgi:hypothetical protein